MSSLHEIINEVVLSQQPAFTSIIPDVLKKVYIDLLTRLDLRDNDLLDNSHEILVHSPVSELHWSLEFTKKLFSDIVEYGCMLVLNYHDVYNILAEAVSTEIDMDALSGVERVRSRKSMTASLSNDDVYYIDYGVSDFSFNTWQMLFKVLADHVNDVKTSRMIKILDGHYATWTDEDRATVKLLCGNYGYLIRAFYNNQTFAKRMMNLAREFRMDYL